MLCPLQEGLWDLGRGCPLSLEPAPRGSPGAPPHTPAPSFPSVSSVELIHPRDTQLGRKTRPNVFQVTAAPAAEGEGMKLGTDGAGGRGVRGAGDGGGLGNTPVQGWVAWPSGMLLGPGICRGHLSELVRGPLEWKPQQASH